MNIDGTDTGVDIRIRSKTNDGVMESIDHIKRTVKGRSMGYGDRRESLYHVLSPWFRIIPILLLGMAW